MVNLNDLYTAILIGKSSVVVVTTKGAIEESADPQYVINECIVKAMEEIGSRSEVGRAFVPELLMATHTMKESLELLKPRLTGNHSRSIAKIIIGTAKGDLHDIGKNLVTSMFEGCGFEVTNSDIDVSAKEFINAICKYHASILCMSALLTATVNYMYEIIAALSGSGMREKVKVMTGSAPATLEFARQIDADGYGDNTSSAAILAENLLAS